MSEHPISMQDLPKLTQVALLDHIDATLAPFVPKQGESDKQRMERASAGIDQIPAVYAWFMRIHGYYDWMTDSCAQMHGMKSTAYKEARQRRDAAERAVSAAKMFYQSCSRMITVALAEEDEMRMGRPR